MTSRPYKYAYPTEAERLERKRIHDLELAKLKAATPREGGKPAGQPPFGLALGQLFNPKTPSRPYKKQGGDKGKGGERQGQGQLVRQVTPGALRKNPNPIESLIKAIWDFFAGITNRPEPVEDFMAKYPKPATTTT